MLDRFKPQSESSRNILTLMTGTTIAQAIPVAISPILTRIYTPSDFGVFALFIALIALFSPIASARYEQALLLPAKDEDALSLFALGFFILLSTSLLLTLFIVIFHTFLLSFFENKSISFWLYFIPLTVFFIGLFNLLSYWNNRKKLYTALSQATIFKAVALAIVQIGIGLLKDGATGLISGQIIAQLVANTRLLKSLIFDASKYKVLKPLKILALSKKYRNFPMYQIPHVIFNTVGTNLPIYIFSSFFSAATTGLYALSTRIVLAPLMIISGAYAKVYNEIIVQRIHSNQESYHYTLSFLKSLAIKVLPIIIIITFFAPEIFAFVFGEMWREAGIYTQILSPWLFINIMVASVAYIPSVLGMQKKALYVSMVQVLVSTIALSIGVMSESVYIALIAFMISSSLILLYNLTWFLASLKALKEIER